MFLSWFILSLAAAEPTAHHHPDAVARASTLFRQAQEHLAPGFERAQQEVRRRAQALEQWQLALDLLGSRAPDPEQHHRQQARQAFLRDQATISSFAQDQMERVDQAFQGALARALTAAGGETWPVCAGQPARGLRMGPGPRAPSNPCPGEDQSADLAARLDQDPELRDFVDQLSDTAWPSFADPPGAGQPTEGDGLLDLVDLLQRHAATALRQIDQREDRERLPIEAALEQDPSPDELRQLRARVTEIERATAQRRHAVATPVLDALDHVAERRSRAGAPQPAYCVRPQVYGGCHLPPLPPDEEEAYVTHPRVRKALSRAGR